MWAAVAVGLPLIARALHAVADLIESRRGSLAPVIALHTAGRGAEKLRVHLTAAGRRSVGSSRRSAGSSRCSARSSRSAVCRRALGTLWRLLF